MSLADAFAPIEAHYEAKAQEQTWGHLAPKKNKTYRGRIVYAIGCYSHDRLNPTVLVCKFSDLEDSPWFMQALDEFLSEQEFQVGCVYEFLGGFRNYVFHGSITTLLNANEDRQLPTDTAASRRRRAHIM